MKMTDAEVQYLILLINHMFKYNLLRRFLLCICFQGSSNGSGESSTVNQIEGTLSKTLSQLIF